MPEPAPPAVAATTSGFPETAGTAAGTLGSLGLIWLGLDNDVALGVLATLFGALGLYGGRAVASIWNSYRAKGDMRREHELEKLRFTQEIERIGWQRELESAKRGETRPQLFVPAENGRLTSG